MTLWRLHAASVFYLIVLHPLVMVSAQRILKEISERKTECRLHRLLPKETVPEESDQWSKMRIQKRRIVPPLPLSVP